MLERSNKKKIVIISSIAGFVVLIAAVYLGMAFYFRSHFLFRTDMNGWKVGGMTVEKAEEKIGSHAEDYLLTVYDRDGNKHHVYGRDIQCKYVSDGSVEKALKEQNPFGWVVSLFKGKELDVTVPMEYEEELISGAVADMECFDESSITEPQDARITKGEDGYQIEPEVKGNHLVFDQVLAKVKEAVSAGQESLTLEDEDYRNPAVASESQEIQDAMEVVDRYQNAVITYQVQGGEEVLGKEQLQKFIDVNGFQVSIKEEEIKKYVQSLASKYNTYADVRNFKTSSGDTVQIGGGDYGWVINKSEEAEQIKADMGAGKPVTREPKYTQRAYVEGADDIGKTYIEIDYTKQHMWYYKDGVLVTESDVVTGNISRSNGSPDGVYKIVYKQSPAVLKGETYRSDVTYFLPFAYNVGIHDASWRNQFGGEDYKTNGSHGCINAPLEVAKTIYETVEVGTPVIAYYREPVKLTAENCRISNAYSYVKE